MDALGRALRLIITEGQEADISCPQGMVEGLRLKAVIADEGYNSDAFVKSSRVSRAEAVIPPRSNRKTQRRYYYRALYRQRNVVERFNRIKHFRRVATRYDKLPHSGLRVCLRAARKGEQGLENFYQGANERLFFGGPSLAHSALPSQCCDLHRPVPCGRRDYLGARARQVAESGGIWN